MSSATAFPVPRAIASGAGAKAPLPQSCAARSSFSAACAAGRAEEAAGGTLPAEATRRRKGADVLELRSVLSTDSLPGYRGAFSFIQGDGRSGRWAVRAMKLRQERRLLTGAVGAAGFLPLRLGNAFA